MHDLDRIKEITSLSRRAVLGCIIFMTAITVLISPFLLGTPFAFVAFSFYYLWTEPFARHLPIYWIISFIGPPLLGLVPFLIYKMWSNFSRQDHGRALVYGIFSLLMSFALFFLIMALIV